MRRLRGTTTLRLSVDHLVLSVPLGSLGPSISLVFLLVRRRLTSCLTHPVLTCRPGAALLPADAQTRTNGGKMPSRRKDSTQNQRFDLESKIQFRTISEAAPAFRQTPTRTNKRFLKGGVGRRVQRLAMHSKTRDAFKDSRCVQRLTMRSGVCLKSPLCCYKLKLLKFVRLQSNSKPNRYQMFGLKHLGSVKLQRKDPSADLQAENMKEEKHPEPSGFLLKLHKPPDFLTSIFKMHKNHSSAVQVPESGRAEGSTETSEASSCLHSPGNDSD